MMFDAIVVGGSYAGLSAALQLARARRKILVIDAGQRRNRFASTSHGFLGQDGRGPGEIVADARKQLAAYQTVEFSDDLVEAVGKADKGFSAQTASHGDFEARRLILATGVADELPDVPGLRERWGKSIFHCPYCHGYELDQGQIGVLAVSDMSMHHALMLPDWGPTTLFLNGAFVPDADQLAKLQTRGVKVESEPVARIAGDQADVELRDGRVIPLAGLFTMSKISPASPLAAQLGCVLEEGPLGSLIQTNGAKETTVAGVFACGDATRSFSSVAIAVADGATAGAGTHQSLIFHDH
ncbi:NAD(P)/FAD-dependent oxidoreductase [Pseudaminobacter soli (ex Li et al. 2025)]|uniref:Thioredoxin reductase n=1 Tax=Pseudaminobacter soli (ex Li et al. 2025) TaxID=1295366 RepID=A0A2P7SFQ0_9HYPH|nr:NAD(P)/FAD-dependent oxidoreductase [Mesorhizobium soli]PSJ61300.1 thioredoxin reductase [Mesorhizobium soli]